MKYNLLAACSIENCTVESNTIVDLAIMFIASNTVDKINRKGEASLSSRLLL